MILPQFTRAQAGPKNTTEYYTSDDRVFVFSVGSWAWRNNNPGNLRPGDVAKRHHSLGKSGGFSVFQDYETGHDALIDSLKSTFGNKNLSEAIEKYAPKNENNTEKYLAFLRKMTGVKDFSKEQFAKLWQAIEQTEDWKEGNNCAHVGLRN